MTMEKKIVVDCKTGKEEIIEFDFTSIPSKPEPIKVEHKDLVNLIAHAKSQGWIT